MDFEYPSGQFFLGSPAQYHLLNNHQRLSGKYPGFKTLYKVYKGILKTMVVLYFSGEIEVVPV